LKFKEGDIQEAPGISISGGNLRREPKFEQILREFVVTCIIKDGGNTGGVDVLGLAEFSEVPRNPIPERETLSVTMGGSDPCLGFCIEYAPE